MLQPDEREEFFIITSCNDFPRTIDMKPCTLMLTHRYGTFEAAHRKIKDSHCAYKIKKVTIDIETLYQNGNKEGIK